MNGPTDKSPALVPSGASAIIAMFDTLTPDTVDPFASTAVTLTDQPAGKSRSGGIGISSFSATDYPAPIVAYSPSAGKYSCTQQLTSDH